MNARASRDALMFLLGMGGFIHEVAVAGAERPTILLACLALMGVPVFLRKDEARTDTGDKLDRAARAARAAARALEDPEADPEEQSS